MPNTDIKIETMLNKWDYSGVDEVQYSDDKNESYIKSAEFLGDEVEDWGCGTTWSKRYFKKYRGIDGSYHKNVDEVVNLVNYTSCVDNILMRQVLELNTDWKKILENVKKSFKKKFCLVVFTPLVDKTIIGNREEIVDAHNNKTGEFIDMIYFNKQDILDYFPASKFLVREEEIDTKQGYNHEWILYVEKTNK